MNILYFPFLGTIAFVVPVAAASAANDDDDDDDVRRIGQKLWLFYRQVSRATAYDIYEGWNPSDQYVNCISETAFKFIQ